MTNPVVMLPVDAALTIIAQESMQGRNPAASPSNNLPETRPEVRPFQMNRLKNVPFCVEETETRE